ncbi:MAG: c-type cytochrome [Pyrinomonadaceae bacterium]
MTRRQTRRIKIASTVVVITLGLLSAANTYTFGWRPVVGARVRPLTNRTFERTEARRERGRYLVEGVAHCFACHAPRDEASPYAAPRAGEEGAGRVLPSEKYGQVVAPNLTPDVETGAGAWSDDALARAIREGVGHDGRALFPLMPYRNLRQLSDEDTASVVVFLRSLPPRRNALPPTEINFPVNLLIKSAPEPVDAPVVPPDMNDAVARGAYLVRLANCALCHSQLDRNGLPMKGMEFAGGKQFKTASGRVIVSPNLTPDASGISYYDEQMFVRALRTGQVGARRLDPEMPWGYFRHMSDEDLKAIFAYLRTLKPVRHRVADNDAGVGE